MVRLEVNDRLQLLAGYAFQFQYGSIGRLKKASQHPDLYIGYKQAKKLYAKITPKNSSETCRKVYQILLAGDPKNRTVRVVTSDIFNENIQ